MTQLLRSIVLIIMFYYPAYGCKSYALCRPQFRYRAWELKQIQGQMHVCAVSNVNINHVHCDYVSVKYTNQV